MIVIGAAMTATPIIAAVVQHNNQAPFEPSAPAKAVAQIDETPAYTGFRFLTDVSYLDLGNSLVQPSYASVPGWKRFAGHHRHIRPATLINYMTIRKIGPA
jgi:hypothetical protein